MTQFRLYPVLVLWCAMLATACGPKTMGDIVRKNGYTELLPPITTYMPGTIVAYDEKKDVMEYLCRNTDFLGERKENIQQSPGPIEEMGKLREMRIAMSASDVETVNARLQGQVIEAVSTKIENVLIYILDQSTIKDALGDDTKCTQLVRENTALLKKSYAVWESYTADVTITINMNKSANATARLEAAKYLSPTAEVEYADAEKVTTSGKGLIYGVKLLEVTASSTLRRDSPVEKRVDRQTDNKNLQFVILPSDTATQ